MVARSARIRDRLLQVIAAGGFDEVMRQFRQAWLEVALELRLERSGDLAVQLHPRGPRDVLVQAVADQDVCEAPQVAAPRNLCHHAHETGFLQRLQHLRQRLLPQAR